MNQIERVIQVTNMPSKADIDAVASPFASTMLETLPVMNYKTIPETFPSATSDGLDVLTACFHFNPDKRPSAEELLRHVFVAEFHNEVEEPNFPGGKKRKRRRNYHVFLISEFIINFILFQYLISTPLALLSTHCLLLSHLSTLLSPALPPLNSLPSLSLRSQVLLDCL